MSDDELLYLSTERESLVPEASIAVVAVPVVSILWVVDREWEMGLGGPAVLVSTFVLSLSLRNLGARLMRKLDWKWYRPSD